jgi:hypothetical protein
VVSGSFRDLLVAVASTAGALTGLLFVAVSVTRRNVNTGPLVVQQVRAAAALLAFTNALAVSLFSLVPGTNPGYPATALGVIGILFTAAAIRSIRTSGAARTLQRRQIGLIFLLLLIFGTELGSGIAMIASPGSGTALQVIGYALVTSLIVGVARAWELVGDRDTGISASIAVLTGHTPRPHGVTATEAASGPGTGEPRGPEPDG